jgi:hypothetical protein
MLTLLQAATDSPTSWQLIVAIAGVFGFIAACVGGGVIYGRIVSRLEAVEKSQHESIPRSEVALMFEEIKRRLGRIEEEVIESRGRDR